MRTIIFLQRAGINHPSAVDLAKASRPHKYWKREPYFSGGKLKYRYYYNTPEDRERWRREHDPDGDAEHHLASEITRIHKELGLQMPDTATLNADRLKELLADMAPRGKNVNVHISAAFERGHKQPFVDAEEAGAPIERNPIQRVAKAFDMVPKAVRDLVSVRSAKITTRNDPAVKKMFEKADPPRPVPAAFSDRDGNIVLCADGEGHGGGSGFNVHPSGWPRFGSPLTQSEETVWREIGRQLRYALAVKRKDVWNEWKEMVSASGNADQRLSAFARQNVDHDFMESFSCALSHPKQLATQAPQRYEFFRKHGLVDLPPIEEMQKKAEGELAWWATNNQTKPKKIFANLKEKESPVGVPYVSPKDEFYQVSIDGRTVYFRVGPTSPDEEGNWETMPDVIDPETGLPTYDASVALRFRAEGNIKEIYDEHGNRLTDNAAFFYLNQDKESISNVPDSYEEYQGQKDQTKKTHSLAYQMYIALGESRGDAKKEREAVKKMEARGQDPTEKRGERYKKVPHKIPPEEFAAKTPSFAYHNLRSAETQPYKMLENGKPSTHVNPMTGKREEKLHARVYESVNPDGSVARLVVKESPTFNYGDQVWLPVTTYTKDEETGEVFAQTSEQLVTLKEGEHPLDPKALAKEFKIPLNELLERNGRFAQYQLQDPLMAALINPSNMPIKDRASLVALLKSAAEVQPEVWTTVQVGNEIPPSHVHAKVKFDGAGSPLLVGDYWERKLGKVNPRVSDLLGQSGTLKNVQPAKPRKPRRRKIKEGGSCRVKVGDSWVFATVLSKDTSGGKRRYEVAPLPGQGVDTEPMQVRKVKSVPTNMDPERPGIRIREFTSLKSDVLVYVDEVRVNSSGEVMPNTGTVRIKLPEDGSWNFETMTRVPGVRANEDGTLTLDMSEIDRFREVVGGFVIDELAQKRLARQRRNSSMKSGRGFRTPLTDLVDPLNNNKIRADKLLKGMRPKLSDGTDFSLGQHQVELLQAMADNGGRQIAAHFMGTGKTVSALAAVKMMQNLTDENGNPHPNRPKRVAVVVPKSTAQQWVDATAKFTEGKATVIGTVAGGVKMPNPPPGWERMPESEKQAWREKEAKKNPDLWRPEEDDTDIVVITEDYYTRHADELKRIGGFDGIIVDEAHGIQAGGEREEEGVKRGNKRAAKVEEWNPDMKMMMLLTGTPITNRVHTLTNYLKIISNGDIDLGSQDEFRDKYLVESAVQKANGSKKAEKMDIHPQMAGQLQRLMKPYMHIATTADVKGKTIPAVSLDENAPAKMDGVQATVYRGYMGQLTAEEKDKLDLAATLGEDEASLLGQKAQKKVLVARSITATPGYKPKDGRKYVTFEITEKEGNKTKTKKAEFRLPGWGRLKKAFGGRWPSQRDVDAGKLSHGEFVEIQKWVGTALERDYAALAGRSVEESTTAEELAAIKGGKEMGEGLKFGQRVENPEYGPEGAICRGEMTEDGHIKPIEHVIRNMDGSIKEVVRVPVGLRFVRDGDAEYYMGGLPAAHPQHGEFESDWDWDRSGDIEKGQKPKEGREGMNVLTNPARRRERLMLDLSLTTSNAKTDELEKYINEVTDPTTGGNPDGQMIMFGSTYPTLRTMEAKLRLMGYKDVNEVLNEALQGDDPVPSNGKYFVSYMGDGATLGDRDINSEIFRKRKGPDGRDMKMSMFVHRTLHGSDAKPPGEGDVKIGWNRSQRDSIQKMYGIETPAGVTAVDTGAGVEYRYAYESEMNAKDRREYKKLEEEMYVAVGDKKEALRKKINKVLGKYWTPREPLTQRQMHVFNNCQFMVASDAAQVGLNWGNATNLVMYDSLFSPMNEWQRITRAARMLDPAVKKKLEPVFDKLGSIVEQRGAEAEFKEYEGNANGALQIVQDVLEDHPEIRQELVASTDQNPAAIAESFLAQRSIDRINSLRGPIEQQLSQEGRTLESAPKIRDPETGQERFQYIKPEEITSADVMNEIIEKHLKPFEKQILRSRKYLVNVKRLTTSVEVPETETVTTKDADGKKVKVKRPTGNTVVESPSKAEQSVLTAGRAKQVPTEKLLALGQAELPEQTPFDFLPITEQNLTSFSTPVRKEKSAEEKKAEEERKEWYKQQRAREREERRRIKEERRKAEKERKAAKRASTKKSMFYVKR